MADIKKFLDKQGVSTLWSKVAQSVAAEKARAEAAEQANAAAIAGIKNGAAMNDFAAVEAKFTTLQSAVDAKGEKSVVETNAADIVTLKGKVEALEAGTYDDSEVRGLISDNAEAIEALEGAHGTDKAALEAAIALKADKTALEAEVERAKAAEKVNADAIALLTNGVDPETIDGVNDLINYVNTHGTEVTAIRNDIADAVNEITKLQQADTAMGGRVDALETKVDIEGTVSAYVAGMGEAYAAQMETIVDQKDTAVLNAAKAHADGLNTAMDGRVVALEAASATHALASDVTALDGRVTVVEGKVATLEGASHSHDNKEVLDGITSTKVNAWDAAEANAKAHADGLASGLDVRVQTLEKIDHTQFEAAGAAATAEANAKAYTDTEFAKIQALTTAEIEAAIAAASQA